jgi:hypothetical protein
MNKPRSVRLPNRNKSHLLQSARHNPAQWLTVHRCADAIGQQALGLLSETFFRGHRSS